MYVPHDHQFQIIPGLAVRGIFMPALSIAQADVGDGIVWMLARLQTSDTQTFARAEISFKTPYPANIDARWRVADFISWAVSHEMMEAFTVNGAPLFQSDRLGQDHGAIHNEECTFMSRLVKVRQRFQGDVQAGRWDGHVLRDGLSLLLNPAFR